MPTNYPGALDSLPRPGPLTEMDDAGFEGDVVIDNISDAIEAVEAVVGVGAGVAQAFRGRHPVSGIAGPYAAPTPAYDAIWTFDTTTTLAEPAAGRLRLNNASPSSATAIALAASDARSLSVTAWVNMMNAGTSPSVRGLIRLQSLTTPSKFTLYRVTSTVPLGAGIQINVANPFGGAAFANNELVQVTWSPSGFDNPLTTADDIIVGGASGLPTRLAKGANSRVFGVDASGVLGYRQIQTADIANNQATNVGSAALSGSITNQSALTEINAGSPLTLTTSGGFQVALLSAVIFTSVPNLLSLFYMAVDAMPTSGQVVASAMTAAASANTTVAGIVVFSGLTVGAAHQFRIAWNNGTGTTTINNGTLVVLDLKR